MNNNISAAAQEKIDEFISFLAGKHLIPSGTIRLSKTFVHPEGFYQSYEQLPETYRLKSWHTHLVLDHTGIDFCEVFYPWEQIVFTGFIWCTIMKEAGNDLVPYFSPVFMVVTSDDDLLLEQNITEPEFGSIVQIYKRKWKHFAQNPALAPKPFPYEIRRAHTDDITRITTLFKETIQTVNASDYSPEQINLWSSSAANTGTWTKRLAGQYFIVAELGDELTGFGSIDTRGYIDLLYTHKDHQRKGIAENLLSEMEHYARVNGLVEVWSDVSITARPFFASKGFKVKREYLKFVQGVEFEQAEMVKQLNKK